MLGETVTRTAFSPHPYIPSHTHRRIATRPLRQLHSDLGDFSNGDGHVVKITTGKKKKSPDTQLTLN